MVEHERAMMMTTHTRRQEGDILRIGSVAGIVGSLLAMVGNLLHPATPIGDPEGVARTIAQSENWVLIHLVIVVGLILMLGGLVAVSRSIEGGLPGALARLGSVAAVAGITVGVVLVIVDGVAAKHLADAWEAAPPDQAAVALGVVLAEEAINFALASLFNILFAGVTFILLGLAVAWSKEYPRWLGWVVVVAGVGSVPVGLVQAYTGESIGFTRIATIIFPTIITLWVVGMSVLILRKALSKGGRMS
jgi:FtsH-binding integral membrane protein